MKAPPTLIRRLVYALTTAVALAFCLLVWESFFGLSRADSMSPKMRVEADFQALAHSLESYRMVGDKLPSTAEGLDSLIHRPPSATRWYQYFERLPKDPWKHAYVYQADSGSPKGYDLFSLGPDGFESADDIHFQPTHL